MEQIHSENLQLGRLVANALGEIERLGYSGTSRRRYRTTWEHLIEFSHQKNLGNEFSADLAARFLEEYRVRDEQRDKPGDGWRRDMVLGVKVLADFAKNGGLNERYEVSNPPCSPCRKHFVITNNIVRIGFTFDRGPFTGVQR